MKDKGIKYNPEILTVYPLQTRSGRIQQASELVRQSIILKTELENAIQSKDDVKNEKIRLKMQLIGQALGGIRLIQGEDRLLQNVIKIALSVLFFVLGIFFRHNFSLFMK